MFIVLLSTYLFGFRGDVSIAGPGAGISIGNMSTHISSRPFYGREKESVMTRVVLFTAFDQSIRSHLFDSRLVRVQKRSGLHMFRNKLAADSWDLLPVVQHAQG